MSAERLAVAVGDDDLASKDGQVRSVEHVASLAAASNLGSDIFRAKGLDSFAARRAAVALTHRAIKMPGSGFMPISRALAQSIAVCALHEILWPQCRTCNGAKEMRGADNGVLATCPTCAGSGIFKYDNAERAKLCGVELRHWPKIEQRYLDVLALARNHDCAPLKAKERLG